GLELAGYRSFSEIPPRENSKAVSRGKLDGSCRVCGIGLTEERRAHHSDNSVSVCVVDGVERVHTELHVASRTMTLGHGSALEADTLDSRTSSCTIAGARPVLRVTPGGRVMVSPLGSDPVVILNGAPLAADRIEPIRKPNGNCTVPAKFRRCRRSKSAGPISGRKL